MEAMTKWIGGTSLVLATGLGILALGSASLASTDAPSLDRPAPRPATIEGAIAARFAAEAREPFRIKRILPITGPIKYGEWHWDDRDVPHGPVVITVDLQARTLSVFRDGYEIGAAAVMLGTDEHPTPTGVFPILSKERHNVSEAYGNAPMPWTLRLTWDGIAVHGGHAVENGYASHGCVAVPNELAERLFAIAQKGDRVVITDGKQMSIGDRII